MREKPTSMDDLGVLPCQETSVWKISVDCGFQNSSCHAPKQKWHKHRSNKHAQSATENCRANIRCKLFAGTSLLSLLAVDKAKAQELESEEIGWAPSADKVSTGQLPVCESSVWHNLAMGSEIIWILGGIIDYVKDSAPQHDTACTTLTLTSWAFHLQFVRTLWSFQVK